MHVFTFDNGFYCLVYMQERQTPLMSGDRYIETLKD